MRLRASAIMRAELVALLQKLAGQEEEAELVIVGDIFGMWESTNIKGPEKLQALMQQFPIIFEAFREAGEKIKITLLPGNHDYEIAPPFSNGHYDESQAEGLKRFADCIHGGPAGVATAYVHKRRLLGSLLSDQYHQIYSAS
jgi:hypothetical protein